MAFFGTPENNFMRMYKRLLGPESRDENGNLLLGSQKLFSEDYPYSPFCYIFLLVDNTLRLSSSTRDNRVIYIGVKEMWNTDQYGTHSREPVKVQHVANVYENPDDKGVALQKPIEIKIANAILFPAQFANKLSIEENDKFARRQLTYNYNSDCSKVESVDYVPAKYETDKLGGGDFVIMYVCTTKGMFVYHIEAQTYLYRVLITNNDPNFYHQFVVQEPWFYKESANVIVATQPGYPVINTVNNRFLEYDTSENRLHWLNSILYECCRIEARPDVANYTNKLNSDIEKVAKFILDPKNQEITDVEEKKRLNEKTIGRFKGLYNMVKNVRGGRPPYEYLKELLHRETGGSLYKLITTVHSITKLRQNK